MKNIKFSSSEKILIRTLLIFAFIQILILLLFIRLLNESKPITTQEIQRCYIVVEKTQFERAISEYRFIIYSDSQKYYFGNRATRAEYSCSELYATVSVGDQLSIAYYEENSIWGNKKWVVEACSEIEAFRLMEEYNKGKKGLTTIVYVGFFIIQLVSLGFFIIYIWFKLNIFKGLARKLKTDGSVF